MRTFRQLYCIWRISILIWLLQNHLLFWPTLCALTGFSASTPLFHTVAHWFKNASDSGPRRHNEYQVEMRWQSKLSPFFSPFCSLHQQWLSNPPSTSEPWSSDSSNHKPLKMSLSSENGSMEKSIKGFNVVSLPWLPGFSLLFTRSWCPTPSLIVSAKIGREHYV